MVFMLRSVLIWKRNFLRKYKFFSIHSFFISILNKMGTIVIITLFGFMTVIYLQLFFMFIITIVVFCYPFLHVNYERVEYLEELFFFLYFLHVQHTLMKRPHQMKFYLSMYLLMVLVINQCF